MDLRSPLPFLVIDRTPVWEMPELPSLHKLPARATLWPFADANSAHRRIAEATPLVKSLNGQWQFTRFDTPLEVTPAALLAASWDNITVPGNWTMQYRQSAWSGEGFSKPHYTNIQMPFPETFPHIPKAIATGVYRTEFRVPAEWGDQRIVLHFAGCEGALFVYIDDAFVGMNKDSRTPAEYDITDTVTPGMTHILTCVNPRYSDASWLEDQDHWWQAGIHRDVCLYATPQTYIHDIATTPELSDDHGTGTMRVHTTIRSRRGGQPSGTLQATLLNSTGQIVATSESVVPGETIGYPMGPVVSDTTTVRMALTISNPALWSCETPNLYTLVVQYDGPHGRVATATRVGFRTVVIRDRELLINGVAVMIHGVNYHEHSDEHGKAVPRALMELDIRTMKAHNINAVRTSHYPNNPYWYDLCDEYGIMLVGETNLEHHAVLQISDDTRVAAAYAERVRNAIQRDKNHPSVIIWSLGNESGHGANHEAVAAWIRHVDPSRPLHYEGALSPFFNDNSIGFMNVEQRWKRGERVTDLICPMYATIADIVEYVTTIPDHRPLILCEYAHAMGNSSGSLSDYYAAFERYHGLQGGFIWEWLDHGIRTQADDGRWYWVYGGGQGDFPNDGNFVADGMVWPDRTPHPGMREFMYLARPAGVTRSTQPGNYRIENRRFYTSLDDLALHWDLVIDGEVVESGTGVVPHIPAQQHADIALVSTVTPRGDTFLNVRFVQLTDTLWAPAGHVVAWDQVTICRAQPVAPSAAPSTATVSVIDDTLVLRNGGQTAHFDRQTGALQAYGHAGGIVSGPALDVWRAPTDNDKLQEMMARVFLRGYPLWQHLGLTQLSRRIESVTHDNHSISVTEALTGRQQWDDIRATHTYTIDAAGSLAIATQVTCAADIVDLPRIGVQLVLAAPFTNLTWYGRGPHENYSDRKASTLIGRYESTVAQQYTPYIMPQEHGHKVDAQWLRLTDASGRGYDIHADAPFEFNALHHSTAALEQAADVIALQADDVVYLNLDHGMRGLGTGLFVDTLPEYLLNAREYAFRFVITPRA
ncbi:MAG: hypothetical protein RLZZ297_1932 [Chloroflexota bacterium]|jgi:beta-galactosidase